MGRTLYLYKGTTMPMMWLKEQDAMNSAREQLELGLRMSNISLSEQSDDYKNQLNKIEECMYKYCNPSSEEGIKKVAKVCGQSVEHLYGLWCINICCLLILKIIPDDNMNGIMTIE